MKLPLASVGVPRDSELEPPAGRWDGPPGGPAEGLLIVGVREDGPASRAGVRAGERLLAIDGTVPRDLIDLRHQTQGRPAVWVDLWRAGTHRRVRVELSGSGDPGLELEAPTFDGLRQCNNNCGFCFIRGLPKGLRRTLYIRDDDYRYSFLFGSFITLTNLAEADWHRIAYQRLSPLRVSIHATDPEVRAQLLAHPGAPPILPQLRRLGDVGVRVHGQVVLCPGLNDGAILRRTIDELAEIEHVVESLAVVPVGISDHLRSRDIRPVSAEDARQSLKTVLAVHRRERRRLGRGFVYPSDELFLLAGARLPGETFYDGFPQLQNGVGLVRLLLGDWRRQRRRLPGGMAEPRRVAWLCGQAAYPALAEMAADANRVEGLEVLVRAVDNTLFGSAISVSGLMTGRDAVAALRDMDVEVAVLPRSAFGYEGARTLDEWTVEAIGEAARVTVRVAGTARELIAATVG